MDAAFESVDAGGQPTDLHGVAWHHNSRAGRRNARGRRCQGYLPHSTNTVQRRNESSAKGRHFRKRMIFAAAVGHAEGVSSAQSHKRWLEPPSRVSTTVTIRGENSNARNSPNVTSAR